MEVNYYVACKFEGEPHATVIAQFVNKLDAINFYLQRSVRGMGYNLYTTNYGGTHSVLMTPTS